MDLERDPPSRGGGGVHTACPKVYFPDHPLVVSGLSQCSKGGTVVVWIKKGGSHIQALEHSNI